MKIRTGFVSNSSSSSYLIKINGVSEPCPTCGRKNINIIDYIRNFDNGETGIKYENKTSILEDIELNIKHSKERIQEMSLLDPNEVPQEYKNWGYTRTAQQIIEDQQQYAKELQTRYDKISAISGEVYDIYISYHDKGIQEIFDQAVRNKDIEIIERDGD
jgi:hypothetical protein